MTTDTLPETSAPATTPRRGRPRKAPPAPAKPRAVRKETIVVERNDGNAWYATDLKRYDTTADAMRAIKQGAYGKGVLRIIAIKAPLMKVEEVIRTEMRVEELNVGISKQPIMTPARETPHLLDWQNVAFSGSPDYWVAPSSIMGKEYVIKANGVEYDLCGSTDLIATPMHFIHLLDAKAAAEAREHQVRAAAGITPA